MAEGERFLEDLQAMRSTMPLENTVRELEEKLAASEAEKRVLEAQLDAMCMEVSLFEERLHLDHLTQLKNRQAFDAELRRVLALLTGEEEEHRHGVSVPKRVALIFIDLDDFKKANDAHGHIFGDMVLRRVAETFQKKAREGDFVARLGGEEFGIILRDTDEESTIAAAGKFRKALEEINFSDTKVPAFSLTGSFGISSSDDTTDAETLYKYADEAHYVAKRAGKNSVSVHQSKTS